MKLLCPLLFFIALMQLSNGIMISEIMADPIADETLNEWIELYNNEDRQINISGFLIGDDKDNDTIEGGLYGKEGTIIEPFGFAVITDDATRAYNNFNVSPDAARLYIDDSSIGNGLSNGGETIYLYDSNGNLMHNLSYSQTAEGLSWAIVNNSLYKSNPTPGFGNEGTIVSGERCDYATEIILAKTIFDNSSEFSFKIRASKLKGQSTNFTSKAEIEDLNGKTAKEYSPFTNEPITLQRTSTEYTPSLEEGKSYTINANITVQCNDTGKENDFDARIITIKGKPLQEDSSVDISGIYDLGSDNTAKFGQAVRIRLDAYRGNTNKESIAVWAEGKKGSRISKQSKANLGMKYTNYSLTLPVQIEPNCDGEFKDGSYTIKAEGLDSEDEEEIEIEKLTGSMCEIKAIKENSISPKKFNFYLQDFNENIDARKEFNTKVVLDNNNDADIPIKVWSYVYRGSKSYSGDKEDNKKEFILKANSLHIVELSNTAENAEPGNYKYKVVINKNNQKTNDEIIKEITIENNLNKNNKDDNNNQENEEIAANGERNKIANNALMNNGGYVYQSTTEKAKSLVPAFFIALSVLLNIILIWRR